MRLLVATLCLLGCKHKEDSSSVGGPCSPAQMTCGSGTMCDPGSGRCVCPAGYVQCGGSCYDALASAYACGGCNLSCMGTTECVGGRCGAQCALGATDCGAGACVDTTNNPAHCGGCNKPCGDGAYCLSGQCVSPNCTIGDTACFPDCANLTSSGAHCGDCNTACEGGTVCSRGICQASCEPGLTACGNSCADLKHDTNHCGACDTVCTIGEVCASDGAQPKCQKYRLSGCTSCTGCTACGTRSCCMVATTEGEFAALCVDGSCPLSN
jgi:Stigma-specific protein, Stig1